jgi:DNA recombination protein RmuC
MNAQLVTFALAIAFGLVVGALAAWLAAKAARGGEIEAAVALAQAGMGAELAQLRERARLSEEAKREDLGARLAIRGELDKARNDLDLSRDEVARLTERAGHVPELLQKVQDVELDIKAKNNDLLRVSQGAAQAVQQVSSLSEQLESETAQSQNLRLKLDAANEELKQVTGETARLKEQAERVEPLQEELTAVRVRLEDTSSQLASLRESAANEASGLRAELNAEREGLTQTRQELTAEKQAKVGSGEFVSQLRTELAELNMTLANERKSAEEKLTLLQHAREALSDQFRVLANEILEEKSQKFAEQNKTAVGALLEPLRTQLTDFKAKVEEVYVQEGKDRSTLAEQVRQLQALNATLSQDAQNLTNALKGNAQTQGAWGELILETVLESSGLRKGEQYFVQDTQVSEEGRTGRPDVVILLPQGRKLVVDSKVSLVAYEEYCSGSTEEDKAQALKRHLQSVRQHIGGLSQREYQKLYESLDFVLMFVPLEPAFMAAVSNDKSLFMDAWNRNVLLVSPSTLLFVVRTVAHLWMQEAQSRNAQDIAKRGAALYDKLVDFVRDLEQIGAKLDAAKASYDEAHKRLSTGRGNIVWPAETLKQLGVKASKAMPTVLVERSAPDIVAVEELAAIAASNTPRERDEGLTP